MKRVAIVFAVLLVVLVVLRYQVSEGFQSAEEIAVIICKADWCGHCQKAAPEFDRLVAASPIALSNGKKAVVKRLDADKDKTELAKYTIRGFPTILVQNGGETIEYPNERTYDGVVQFLNQM
jgi:thiol-disulfide isomerase/thioredoxin